MDRLKKVEFDELAERFHRLRHSDKGFNAFYRSNDFGLWIADLIKSGELIALM